MPTTDHPAPFLSLQNLHKAYPQSIAIEQLSLDIARGEFMTFLGPSGSGKSTTLYITAGFEDPTQGRVILQGKDLRGIAPAQRNIGMVFQRYTLFPHLSVAENIAFPLRVRQWSKKDTAQQVEKMLQLVHLEGYGARKPAQLSGGQQQRVAIARALAYQPPILLMDEPLSALDKKLREELQLELRRIHRETGVTILYVTHDQEEALRLSDRIAVFNQGRIEQVGTGPELYEKPATHFVASFIGNSNFLPVQWAPSASPTQRLTLPDGSGVSCPNLGTAMAMQSNAWLMVRPDAMRLLPAEQGAASGTGLTVTILNRSYLGDSLQFTVRTRWGQELHARMGHSGQDLSALVDHSTAQLVWDENRTLCYPAKPT
jgi:putative spermidine/putrescine transport system ATP-binding protein